MLIRELREGDGLTAKEFSALQPIINSDALNKRYGYNLSQAEKLTIRFYYTMKLVNNNWRRRHGLPMRRRGK